jgi:hypothetical protein
VIQLTKNQFGLYEFSVTIKGPKKSKVLKGLIDTGSTHCACTYPVITTLLARPTSFSNVSTCNDTKRCLFYLIGIGFDGRIEQVELIRVQNLPEGIHLILGMSFLSKCKIKLNDQDGQIEWEPKA